MAINEVKSAQAGSAAAPRKADPKPAQAAAPSELKPAEPQDRVELSPQARKYDVPGEDKWHPPVDESERTPEMVTQQNATVEEALKTGKPVTFTDAAGKTSELAITRNGDQYSYTLNGNPVEVDFTQSYNEQDRTELLSKLADYHSRSPEFAQDSFREVHFADRPEGSNTDARFEGWDRSLTFYGKGTLDQTNFDHEVGHAVGYKESFATVPDGWQKAVERDQNEISTYGKESYEGKKGSWREFFLPESSRSDDFAESYAAYKEAREAGPQAMDEFRRKYPERSAMLDKYFPGELRDSPMPSPLGDGPVYA